MQLKWPMLWDLFSLFPAYAGVIPVWKDVKHAEAAFPRIRGGDPSVLCGVQVSNGFSPHTRG